MSQAKEIGPFPGRVKPARAGLYKRVSRATGQKCWAWWNEPGSSDHKGRTHKAGFWGLYSDTKANAVRRAHKRSKKVLPWFGMKGTKKAARK